MSLSIGPLFLALHRRSRANGGQWLLWTGWGPTLTCRSFR